MPVKTQVDAEKVRLLYQQSPSAWVTNTLLGAGVVLLAGDGRPTRQGLIWFALVLSVVATRLALFLAWRRARPTPQQAPVWGRRFALAMLANGLAWGAGAWLVFPPGQVLVQVGVTAIVVSLASGITATTLSSMPGVLAFLFAGVAPYAIAFAFEPTFYQRVIAALIPVFVVGNALRARTNANTLTELLTLRLDVARQRDLAEQANVAKSRFLAAASHDLRQPLHAMTLFAAALDDRVHGQDERQLIGSLKAALAAMGKLFNALLDLSRLDAGTVEPKREHFALAPLLQRLSDEHAPVAAAKGLEWRCEIPPVHAHSDPVLVETILRNLCSNALRYTRTGHVSLGCRSVGGEVALVVEDSGIGIPAAQQEEIFREYHQLHNAERDSEKGLGLGLAIVDRLARLLGHRLELHSVPGEGSRFTVYLPLGSAPQASERAAAPVEPAPAAELSGMAVLVIDDQAAVRESMQVLLGGWGCQVLLADSGEQAAQLAKAGPGGPELIVADYRLRDDETGGAAIARVRQELGRKIPALIITGDTAPERLKEAHAEGFALMHKPVAPARLRAFLRSVRRERARAGA